MIGHLYMVLMARLDLDGSIAKEWKFTRVANVNLTWTLLGFTSKINEDVLGVGGGKLHHMTIDPFICCVIFVHFVSFLELH